MSSFLAVLVFSWAALLSVLFDEAAELVDDVIAAELATWLLEFCVLAAEEALFALAEVLIVVSLAALTWPLPSVTLLTAISLSPVVTCTVEESLFSIFVSADAFTVVAPNTSAAVESVTTAQFLPLLYIFLCSLRSSIEVTPFLYLFAKRLTINCALFSYDYLKLSIVSS